jgi:hypothetical protein
MRDQAVRLIAKELQLELSSASRTLHFHGESMRPFLVEGDAVVVALVKWDEIRTGDVVTYRVDEKFPTRRVVGRSRNGLFLWCENWPERRFFSAREDLLGRVVARKRDGVWITGRDPEWSAARRNALSAYWRRYALAVSLDAVRRAVLKLARLAGLRNP